MGTANTDVLYKVVLVGDSGVGKTHLMSRYLFGTLPKRPQSTIAVEFASRDLRLPSGDVIKAQIWDTAGQERFRAITKLHYRGASGSLLVYDLTNRESFRSVQRWLEDLREHLSPNAVILLVGNKLDLERSERQVQRCEAEEFAEKAGLLFAEMSAVTMTGVQDAFERLFFEIHKRKLAVQSQGVSIESQVHPTEHLCCAK